MQVDKLFISGVVTWEEMKFLWSTPCINFCSYSTKFHFSKRECQCFCGRFYTRDRVILFFIILWTPPVSTPFLSNVEWGYQIIWFSFCLILLCLAKIILVCLRCSYFYFRSLKTSLTAPDSGEHTRHLLWKETDFFFKEFYCSNGEKYWETSLTWRF